MKLLNNAPESKVFLFFVTNTDEYKRISKFAITSELHQLSKGK